MVDGKCFVYSPETGKTINAFRFNTAGATTAKELRVDGDIILIGCSDKQWREDFQPYGHSCFSEGGYRDSTELVCLDHKTGAVLWHRKALDRFGSQSLAIGAGIVFCVDSFSMIEINKPKKGTTDWTTWEQWKKKADGLKEVESTLFALDPRTGNELWSRKVRAPTGQKAAPRCNGTLGSPMRRRPALF